MLPVPARIRKFDVSLLYDRILPLLLVIQTQHSRHKLHRLAIDQLHNGKSKNTNDMGLLAMTTFVCYSCLCWWKLILSQ